MSGLKGSINRYTCDKCHKHIITIQREDGTTAFMIACKFEGCNGDMYSAFGNVSSDAHPTYEWVKPENPKKLKGDMRRHVEMGGLLLRPLVP